MELFPDQSAGYTISMSNIARRMIYGGRVQGVGFRATTRRLATDYPVSGYVKNLDDGSVEVVASGNPVDVANFLAAIDREFAANIYERSEADVFSDSGEPSGFHVRY
jgi:acylphosphatase